MTEQLPVYGPTAVYGDEGITPHVIVRVAIALSREQLETALGISYAEIAADRSPESLTVEEVRSEVEGFLAAPAVIDLDNQIARDRARGFTPEQERVMGALSGLVERAYPEVAR